MNTSTVKFNDADNPEFYKELRKRVNRYFKEKQISRYGNVNMVVKTIFMTSLYLVPLVLMLTGVVSSLWLVIGMWALMGLGMSGIGLAVMHDANHGAYSKNQKVNNIVGGILNLVGGFPINWKIQHNVLHHSFTNIDGYDEDIEKQGIVRFSPTQERRKFFRFQIFYAPLLYGILTAYWATFKDYEQLIRYHKKNLLEAQGINFKRALTWIIFHKVWYYGLTIVLPIMLIDLPWYQTMLGFGLMHFISGLILALIFQSAHVIGETEFYEVDEKGSVENNWAVHQMKTTSNFANGSRWFSWCIGGLNYQIEHHLFPNICHVHYRHISKIVKSTAEEFDVPYIQYKSFFGALKSHFTLIHKLGTGKYDKELAKASA
jgi:linoleoyl-CoA desaturase